MFMQIRKSVDYNVVQFIMILHMALQWQWQKASHILALQQIPHTSPSLWSYGVSIEQILDKIDCVITAPYCSSSSVDFNLNWIPMISNKLCYNRLCKLDLSQLAANY